MTDAVRRIVDYRNEHGCTLKEAKAILEGSHEADTEGRPALAGSTDGPRERLRKLSGLDLEMARMSAKLAGAPRDVLDMIEAEQERRADRP